MSCNHSIWKTLGWAGNLFRCPSQHILNYYMWLGAGAIEKVSWLDGRKEGPHRVAFVRFACSLPQDPVLRMLVSGALVTFARITFSLCKISLFSMIFNFIFKPSFFESTSLHIPLPPCSPCSTVCWFLHFFNSIHLFISGLPRPLSCYRFKDESMCALALQLPAPAISGRAAQPGPFQRTPR